jgi:4-diphosphocytidyl-2-C-methyl-D-erythritol kinase
MSEAIRIKSYAKLNLFLEITGKREDGYHLLKSVMQSVSLFDILEFYFSEGDGIEIISDKEGIPLDEKNLIWKSIEAFYANAKDAERKKITVKLTKSIPAMAGMAGGSSNAAAALMAMNEIYHRPFSEDKLCQIGAKIGADVPFCIMGGTVLCEGIGDKMSRLPALNDCCFAVVKPEISISTPEAYKKFDNMQIDIKPNYSGFIEGIENNDLSLMSKSMYNSLEYACAIKEIEDIKDRFLQNGAVNAMMTGSGSAVFGVFNDKAIAEDAVKKFEDYAYKGVFTPENKGVEIV